MSDPLFHEAYTRARSRFTESGWLTLNPREVTQAIYDEIRLIDAERVAARAFGGPGGGRAVLKEVPQGDAAKGATTGPKVAADIRKPRGKVRPAPPP